MKPIWRAVTLALLAGGAVSGLGEIPGGTELLSAGSSWSYQHRSGPPTPGWNQPNPPVAIEWEVGQAKFGFGDDGEVTVLPDNGTLTTYFRRWIFVEQAGRITNLLGRIIADDGAVVYLNGVEVARLNIYPGPVNEYTLAANDRGRPAETNWVNFLPTVGPLFGGPNLLAVEVHQAGPFSRDMGFDFELWANVPGLRPSLVISDPSSGSVFHAGDNVPVRATIQDLGNQVSNLVFRIDGEPRYAVSANTPNFVWADVPVGRHTVQVSTVLLDGTTVQSGETPVQVEPPAGYAALVPNGSVWRYWDAGTDPGPSWRELSYPDADWASGPAELGYGDGEIEWRPERTLVRYGPNPALKNITTYFRHVFEGPPDGRSRPLVLRLLRDDGAAVYLNGVEVARSNLPPGPVGPGTLASGNAVDDGTVFEEFTIPSGLLAAGPNVLAVEVHQSSPESSDLSFDLMLLALVEPPRFVQQPMSLISPYCIDVTLHAAATGNPVYQWDRNGVLIPGAIAPVLTLTNVDRDSAAIYRVTAVNAGGAAISEPAEVQVCLTKQGPVRSGEIATTNLAALFGLEATTPGGGGGGGDGAGAGGGGLFAAAGLPPPEVHLSHGVPLYFTTKNGGSNALAPDICGVPARHTKWVGYYSPIAQRLRVSTEGSDFDTVLGVYTNSGGLTPALVAVACDRGNAAQPCGVVEFDAQRRFHYVAVDGENGQTGTVRLKIGAGILQSPFYDSAGDTFHFEVAVRSNIVNVVRSTTNLGSSGAAGFSTWGLHGQFTTNRDWVFPQVVPRASTVRGRQFGGQEQ